MRGKRGVQLQENQEEKELRSLLNKGLNEMAPFGNTSALLGEHRGVGPSYMAAEFCCRILYWANPRGVGVYWMVVEPICRCTP